jgi:hypothetical protein
MLTVILESSICLHSSTFPTATSIVRCRALPLSLSSNSGVFDQTLIYCEIYPFLQTPPPAFTLACLRLIALRHPRDSPCLDPYPPPILCQPKTLQITGRHLPHVASASTFCPSLPTADKPTSKTPTPRRRPSPPSSSLASATPRTAPQFYHNRQLNCTQCLNCQYSIPLHNLLYLWPPFISSSPCLSRHLVHAKAIFNALPLPCRGPLTLWD